MTARKPRATPKPAQGGQSAESVDITRPELPPGLPADGTERMAADSDAGVELPVPLLPYHWRPEGYDNLTLVHRNGHLYVDGQLPEKVAFTPAMWAALTGDGLVHNPNVGVNEDKTEISVSAVGVAFGYRLEEQSDPEHWYLAELTDAEVDPEDAEYTLNDYGVYFRG